MGTRSLTVFQDGEVEIAVMYRQFDGYPSGMGNDLKEAFGGFQIVNGYSGKGTKQANGMGCLAAQVVASQKEGCGGIYLYPAGKRDCGEEYIYTLYCDGETGPLKMKVQAGAMTFFGMPGSKQASMPVLFDGLLSDFDADLAEKTQKQAGKIKNEFLESKKS